VPKRICGDDMKTVQLAIHDSEYAQSLRNLLLRDGSHRVHLVDNPDLNLDGVIVVDEDRFENWTLDSEPERFVIVTRKGTGQLSRVWDAGIRHVVFEEDSASTAQLAIIAAELRLPRVVPKSNKASLEDGKRRAPQAPNLPVLDSSRCKCGNKNAHPRMEG